MEMQAQQQWTSQTLATDLGISRQRVMRAAGVYERLTGDALPRSGKEAVLTALQYLHLRRALQLADDFEPGLEIILREQIDSARGQDSWELFTPEQVVRCVAAFSAAQQAGPLSEAQGRLGLEPGQARSVWHLGDRCCKFDYLQRSRMVTRLQQIRRVLSGAGDSRRDYSPLEWYLFYGALSGELWGESNPLKLSTSEGRERFVGRLEELAARLTGERPQDPAPQS